MVIPVRRIAAQFFERQRPVPRERNQSDEQSGRRQRAIGLPVRDEVTGQSFGEAERRCG